jgi:hypothetical protein
MNALWGVRSAQVLDSSQEIDNLVTELAAENPSGGPWRWKHDHNRPFKSSSAYHTSA